MQSTFQFFWFDMSREWDKQRDIESISTLKKNVGYKTKKKKSVLATAKMIKTSREKKYIFGCGSISDFFKFLGSEILSRLGSAIFLICRIQICQKLSKIDRKKVEARHEEICEKQSSSKTFL